MVILAPRHEGMRRVSQRDHADPLAFHFSTAVGTMIRKMSLASFPDSRRAQRTTSVPPVGIDSAHSVESMPLYATDVTVSPGGVESPGNWLGLLNPIG